MDGDAGLAEEVARRGEMAPAANAGRWWTEAEELELRRDYRDLGVHACAAKFGRSAHGIMTKAWSLGLADPDYHRPAARADRRQLWVPGPAEIRAAADRERARALERKRREGGDDWQPSARMARGPTVLVFGRKERPL